MLRSRQAHNLAAED